MKEATSKLALHTYLQNVICGIFTNITIFCGHSTMVRYNILGLF
jgi:hypothetical protein